MISKYIIKKLNLPIYMKNWLYKNIETLKKEKTSPEIIINKTIDNSLHQPLYINKILGNLIQGENLYNNDNPNILKSASITPSTNKIRGSTSNKIIYINCEPNTEYIITKKILGNAFIVADSTNIPKVNVLCNNNISDSSTTTIKYTTTKNANYLLVVIPYSENTKDLQIKKSPSIENEIPINVVTSNNFISINNKKYKINFDNIELAKIGNVQDYIYYENNNWYKINNISKIDSYNNEEITTDYVSTTGELSLGATIYYISTPNKEKITNENIIIQLNNLNNIFTDSDSTIITTGATNNVPMYLEIQYIKRSD